MPGINSRILPATAHNVPLKIDYIVAPTKELNDHLRFLDIQTQGPIFPRCKQNGHFASDIV